MAYLTFFLAALASGLAHSYRAAVDSWHAGSVILTEAAGVIAAGQLVYTALKPTGLIDWWEEATTPTTRESADQ